MFDYQLQKEVIFPNLEIGDTSALKLWVT